MFSFSLQTSLVRGLLYTTSIVGSKKNKTRNNSNNIRSAISIVINSSLQAISTILVM